LYLLQLLYANSISEAHKLYSNLNVNEPVLVGGRKLEVITAQELQSIFPYDSPAVGGNDTAAIFCRSLLMHMQSKMATGILFRVGEHILVASEIDMQVMEVTGFFAMYHAD